MTDNVLAYEPENALFVPNEDPLLFYRHILEFSTNHLKSGGRVYLEINESFGPETLTLIKQKGYADSKIIKDISGKDRIAWCKKES